MGKAAPPGKTGVANVFFATINEHRRNNFSSGVLKEGSTIRTNRSIRIVENAAHTIQPGCS